MSVPPVNRATGQRLDADGPSGCITCAERSRASALKDAGVGRVRVQRRDPDTGEFIA